MIEDFDPQDWLGSLKRTARGFPYIEFTDFYGSLCSLQISSLADDDAIWLGIDNAEPRILASKAASYGVQTTETNGWVEYPIPEGVEVTTRMHLNRQQAAALIPVLQRWVDEGELVV